MTVRQLRPEQISQLRAEAIEASDTACLILCDRTEGPIDLDDYSVDAHEFPECSTIARMSQFDAYTEIAAILTRARAQGV